MVFQMRARNSTYDYYENSGEELGHYISMLHNKGLQLYDYLSAARCQRENFRRTKRVEFFRDNGFHNIKYCARLTLILGDDDINLIARPQFSRVD